MASNLQIDPELLERALQVSGERTKKRPSATLKIWSERGCLPTRGRQKAPTSARFASASSRDETAPNIST